MWKEIKTQVRALHTEVTISISITFKNGHLGQLEIAVNRSLAIKS